MATSAAPLSITFDEAVRFWSKVDITDGCWEWTGAKDERGYGRLMVMTPEGRRPRFAHRIGFLETVGSLPDEELDHLCRNPSCVRSDHLEPVSHAENVRRGEAGRKWREKTHCPSGHAYTAENVYSPPSRPNARYCRACHQARNASPRSIATVAS